MSYLRQRDFRSYRREGDAVRSGYPNLHGCTPHPNERSSTEALDVIDDSLDDLTDICFARLTNHKPVISGTDDAIWRRIRLIPFEVNFEPEKRDKSQVPN